MTPVQVVDKTSFAQSLMHMIKGNLGTGILAMPATFAHCGLLNSALGLPLLCLIATYCVHLLVRSSQQLESKLKWEHPDYAELAKGAFRTGPAWMKRYSGFMCKLTDAVLIVSQMGICCVYLVFIVNNIEIILDTYHIELSQLHLFAAILPFTLVVSYVRTLRRLSIASGFANLLQLVGICIVLEYLLRNSDSKPELKLTKSFGDVALGFGSAMFAFEGISVVLPIYARMKRQDQMGGLFGIINFSYSVLLVLYGLVGLFGYLRFGEKAKDSITLNLPQEPLYDLVRAVFTIALFLTYPLQFYVPAEIVWNWYQATFLISSTVSGGGKTNLSKQLDSNNNELANTKQIHPGDQKNLVNHEYLCRTVLVLITFVLAITVPKLNLMMDLVGSISGTALSIILPPIIHLAVFWEDTRGVSKALLVLTDFALISVGILASASGSYFSLLGIMRSFEH